MSRPSVFTIISIFLLSFSSGLYALESFPANAEAARFNSFIKEIRCVVCQNQSLADSNAPLANDLRQTIDSLMRQQKTDEEIKNYLVKRYGEFILLKPRMSKTTWLLWLFPFAGLTIAFFCLFVNLRRCRRNAD